MSYTILIGVHVLVAVLVLGLIGAVPITARAARRSDAMVWSDAVLRTLLRAIQFGMLAMFLTGALIDFTVGGMFHHAGWFKLSILAFVLAGASLGRVRAALRVSGREALVRVERWGWTTCVFVAGIVLLMETKPLP